MFQKLKAAKVPVRVSGSRADLKSLFEEDATTAKLYFDSSKRQM
jgi:hypothetical protein